MNKEEIQKKLDDIESYHDIYDAYQALRDAFNLGLEVAAENAVLNHDYYDKDEGDYEKFQEYKDFWPNRCDQDGCSYGVDVYSINKESILKYKL